MLIDNTKTKFIGKICNKNDNAFKLHLLYIINFSYSNVFLYKISLLYHFYLVII